ncbi:MAG TPA: squalene synthase HpnC [Candidatus Angelobacter sp.]|nr:squalene synthase HpnC [Candidatus Angelobacter sp.]
MSSAPTDNRTFAATPGASSSGWAVLPPEYAIPESAPSLTEAQQYCVRLATSHYENFPVVTWFLPKHLHQHFYNVYAYCRISDDLGDEVGDKQQSLQLLDQWEAELGQCYDGEPRHPVFVALRQTARQFEIPQHEFSDLLQAFRQDQIVTRYPRFTDLLGYCQYSANPVGHLVLYLCGYRDAERQKLSDYTCTALQLANFWQDVGADFDKGRIYLPLEDFAKFGVSEQELAAKRATPQFLAMMKFEVERARDWFHRGLPLAKQVDRRLALDIELFSRGGMAILRAIERQNYDILSSRPVISRRRKILLLARAALGNLL